MNLPAASGRGITKFSPSDQVLPYSWNPRSKLRGILLRRINQSPRNNPGDFGFKLSIVAPINSVSVRWLHAAFTE